jgi:hypothetical protein
MKYLLSHRFVGTADTLVADITPDYKHPDISGNPFFDSSGRLHIGSTGKGLTLDYNRNDTGVSLEIINLPALEAGYRRYFNWQGYLSTGYNSANDMIYIGQQFRNLSNRLIAMTSAGAGTNCISRNDALAVVGSDVWTTLTALTYNVPYVLKAEMSVGENGGWGNMVWFRPNVTASARQIMHYWTDATTKASGLPYTDALPKITITDRSTDLLSIFNIEYLMVFDVMDQSGLTI